MIASQFKIEAQHDPEVNPFDRQQRITWWNQERISNAKVMVVGAGAIGNETLKNLALLGFRNVFIADFDTVSTSNLSRTVLFRKTDVGRKKAELAAERFRELCLAESPNVDWFHGDVVWDLGTGIYCEMDLVLGCLDNVETRFAVNRQCWLADTPWIDAGINELGVHVTVYKARTAPCYQCRASKAQLIAKRQRYSCDAFKRAYVQEGKVPTVQIASALASAWQVQEAMKLLCDQPVRSGVDIYYQGKFNDFDLIGLPVDEDCEAHVAYPNIISLPLTSDCSLREFLQLVSLEQYSGSKATLDFSGDLPPLVISVRCNGHCNRWLEFYRPSHRILDTELICADCANNATDINSSDIISEKNTLSKFELQNTPERILAMRLYDVGIPWGHIVAVHTGDVNATNDFKYYELTGDKQFVLPNLSQD